MKNYKINFYNVFQGSGYVYINAKNRQEATKKLIKGNYNLNKCKYIISQV